MIGKELAGASISEWAGERPQASEGSDIYHDSEQEVSDSCGQWMGRKPASGAHPLRSCGRIAAFLCPVKAVEVRTEKE